MKMAAAYQRDGKILLYSESKTTAGLWILSGPGLLQTSSDNSLLGQSFLAVLNGSFEQVPHPTNWKGSFNPVLQKAGVKSYKAFMKNCKRVGIESDAGVISFLPMKNLGPSEGFESIADKIVSIASGDVSDIGEKLNAAFDLAI